MTVTVTITTITIMTTTSITVIRFSIYDVDDIELEYNAGEC